MYLDMDDYQQTTYTLQIQCSDGYSLSTLLLMHNVLFAFQKWGWYVHNVANKYLILYVTGSGKRYHSAQKFEIALAVPRESAQRMQYIDANPAFIAHSYSAL